MNELKNVKDNFNIIWYVLCWNEMPILPFMVDYWKLIARKVILYDNNSTDGSIEYLKNFDWIEVRPYPIETNNTIDDNIHIQIKNKCWKEQKNNNVDFVIVSDLDEIVWSNNLLQALQYFKDEKFAIIKSKGYDFISKEFPIHSDLLLHEQIETCSRNEMWDKCILFQPDLVDEINYLPGCHSCNPLLKNNCKINYSSDLFLFHFKYLGVEYLILKRNATNKRLSENNIKNNWGFEYQYNKKQILQQFNEKWENCINFKDLIIKQISYKSVDDLSATIRNNLWKIPENIDLIVGVPRSGMFCAILISQMLNKPVISLNDFLENKTPDGGGRMAFIKNYDFKNILVVDDTVCSGKAMNKVKDTIHNFIYKDKYNFIYSCVYSECNNAKNIVDLCLENVRKNGVEIYLYEWNIMHFDNGHTQHFMSDIDGVICENPPDESINIEAYEYYIKNPKPIIIPSRKYGAFVTYRLNKYREATEKWLKSLDVEYNELWMFNANSYDERAKIATSSQYKSYIYGKSEWAYLFIESNDKQAQEIAKSTNKPVFCFETGRMYNKA